MKWRGVMAVALVAAAGQMMVGAQGRGGGFPGGRGGFPAPGPESAPDTERPQEPPVFRGGVTLVQIDALVTDAKGNPVKGLTADDFEVLEAGQPRQVATFAAVDIPIDPPVGLPGENTAEPDVQTNAIPQGRTYLIAFDEVSPDRVQRARNFVRRFIAEYMGPNDVAAVALTGRGLATSGQDFTGSRRLILNAVDKFSGGFASSTPNVKETPSNFADDTPEAQKFQGPAPDSAFSSDPRQLAASLRKLTEFLATLPGRKTLLYIGEGFGGLDFFNAVDYRGGALTPADIDAHEAVAAATRGNVAIYPVDPRGLTTDLTPAAVVDGREPGQSAILENRSDMAALADVTGGFAITNTNDLGPAFERVVRENSNYYTIGFNSEYTRRDGRFVRVEVRVKRQGLQVRSRNGYVAPLGNERRPEPVEGDTRFPAVKDALASATSTRGLPISVFAAPYRASGDKSMVALAVEIDVSALGLAGNAARAGDIEVSYIATDASGKVRPGRRHTAKLAVKGEPSNKAARQHVRMLSQFELPDGRYQVRVSAGSASMAGSVIYDLDVPDFGKGPLALSGIALTTASAAAMTTLRPHDPLGDVLPAPPTASREFARGEQVVLFAEVYDNLAAGRNDSPRTIELTASLLNDRGRVIRIAGPEQRASTAPRRKSGGHGFTARLPLDVEPGAYVISVATRSGEDGPTVSRRIPIRVR